MKNPNELKESIQFKINESDSIIEYLEGMALKGWKLKATDRLYHFEKIEPQKLYYTVGIIKKPSFLDIDRNDNVNEIIKNHCEAGWEYVTKNREIVIFVTDKEEVKPVEVDEKEKLKYIFKKIVSDYIFTLLFYTILSFGFFKDWNLGEISSSYVELLFFLLLFVIYVIILFKIIIFFIWYIKHKYKLKRGNKVIYKSSLSFKNKLLFDKIRFIFVCILILCLFISIVTDSIYVEDKNYKTVSSLKTFLSSNTTYKIDLKDGSTITVDVFKSNHEFLVSSYTKAKTRNSDKVYLPEWDAQHIYKADFDNIIIVYDDCVISFYKSKLLDKDDIEKIKALKD